MCDFFEDDFEDEFDDGEYMDDNQLEDGLEENLEIDELLAGDTGFDDKPDRAESRDGEFTAKDAFIIGGATGYAYEEGLRERKRRKQKN